jgi:hypothetical protein
MLVPAVNDGNAPRYADGAALRPGSLRIFASWSATKIRSRTGCVSAVVTASVHC